MNIVEAVRYRAWISGIFQHEAQLQEYMKEIPEDLQALQQVIKVPIESYPFFIIEEQGFTYLQEQDFLSYLDRFNFEHADGEDILFNIYVILSDYRPQKPGKDYMGLLRHMHVDRDFCESYRGGRIEYLREIGFWPS